MQENQISFDFLIGSQFLRTSLIEHVTEMEISIEEVVVECIEKYIPPEPMDCIMQDDWISAIDLCENWLIIIYNYIDNGVKDDSKRLLYT